jgi:hypothetical protein
MSENELLIRGIVHPMFCHSNKPVLKREAFLPPPDKNDVSLLRLEYADNDFCKNHAKNLVVGNNTYTGLGLFLAKHVYEINQESDVEIDVKVEGTPIDHKGNYISIPPVFVSDSGLPMHADIIYSEPTVRGEPAIKHRVFASKLAKIAKYFPDPNPFSDKWDSGDNLRW